MIYVAPPGVHKLGSQLNNLNIYAFEFWVLFLSYFILFFERAWVEEGKINIIMNNAKSGITMVVQ